MCSYHRFSWQWWVLVTMSCSEDRPVEHAKLRSAIISLVCQLQQEHCSSLEVREFLVSPSLVRQYSFDSLPDTDLFAIKHVAMSILLHKPTISNQSNEFINHLSTQSLPLEPHLPFFCLWSVWHQDGWPACSSPSPSESARTNLSIQQKSTSIQATERISRQYEHLCWQEPTGKWNTHVHCIGLCSVQWLKDMFTLVCTGGGWAEGGRYF